MGVAALRAAFNEVSAPTAMAQIALLEYISGQETEFQVCYFSGCWSDGEGFTIKSGRVRPSGDVNAMARATAEQLLQRKRV